MFSVQEVSEVGPLPRGRGKFGVLIWQYPLTLKPPIEIYKKALKSEKARIRLNHAFTETFDYRMLLYMSSDYMKQRKIFDH